MLRRATIVPYSYSYSRFIFIRRQRKSTSSNDLVKIRYFFDFYSISRNIIIIRYYYRFTLEFYQRKSTSSNDFVKLRFFFNFYPISRNILIDIIIDLHWNFIKENQHIQIILSKFDISLIFIPSREILL